MTIRPRPGVPASSVAARPRAARRWGAVALTCALAIFLAWRLWPESTDPSRGGARREEARGLGAEVAPIPPPGSGRDAAPATAAGDGGHQPGGTAAPPREAAPAPEAAALADRTDRRFRVRWGEPGLCGPGDAARLARRPALLQTFLALDAARATVRHDPRVDREVLTRVQATVVALQSPSPGPIRRLLGVELDRLSPPEVFVYADAQQLQDVSCVNRAAIGYYDGAIHLSGDVRHGPELVRQTVVHEYVHHVLIGLGIEVPTWLHEGLAMELAGETWWSDPALGLVAWLREKHLPFEAMTGAFPHAADETFALAAYYQSLSMLEFLRELRGDDRILELVQALASGAVAPEDAFSWAAGTSDEALEQAWRAFVARRYRDRDAPMQQLEEAAARLRR